MADARTVIARAVDEGSIVLDSHGRACLVRSDKLADAIMQALAAARLAVVPVPAPEGAVVEAAARERLRAFCDGCDEWPSLSQKVRDMHIRAIASAAGIIAAAEREACAKIADACEEKQDAEHGAANTGGAASAAAAIRAGGRDV